MQEFTFKFDTFYFKIYASDDIDAVNKARRALEESFPERALDHLKIDLDGGAFDGRLYIEPMELSKANIIRRDTLPEPETGVPF